MEKETKEFIEKLQKATSVDHMTAFGEIKRMTIDRLKAESGRLIEESQSLVTSSNHIIDFIEKVVKP